MFVSLLVLWVIDGRIKKEQVLHAFLASLISYIVTLVIKGLLPAARPFELNGKQPLIVLVHTGGAFPSLHTAVAFALAFSIWLHNKKIGTIFLIMAVFVGLGRIWGNVHFLADILGGIVIGITTAYIIKRLHLFGLLK